MEEYKPPKMFPTLREMVDEKIAQPTAEGGWKKLKKGPKNVQIENAVPVAPKIAAERAQSLPPSESVPKGRSDFRPGDQFFLEKSSFSSHEAPDFEVKSIDRDGNIISLEKGAKRVLVDSPDKFARIIGTDDGAKYDEIGKSKDDRAYGRGLLEKLNRVDVLSIEGEGSYDASDNELLQLAFLMSRQHLKEMVIAYEKKLAERGDATSDLQEIVVYSKKILEIFSFGKEADTSGEPKPKKSGRKPQQKKMRQDDESADGKTGGKPAVSKGAPKKKDGVRARRPKEGNVSTDGIQASVAGSESVANEMPGENGNEGEDLSADFRYLLADEIAPIDTKILSATSREDVSFISFRSLPDGMKVFIEMTKENGLKRIYDQLIRNGKKSEAFKLKQEWVAENHRLEMVYLKQRLLIEILAVGADIMDRINSSSQKSVLRSIGRIIHRGASSERIFIPSDPGNSVHDPSGTEGIREAIQDMISIWREERVPKEQKGNNFEAYFKKEFSQIIDKSNRRIREFFEKKWAEMGADAARSKRESPVSKSTEVLDVAALERSALQSAEQYFTDEAIPAIETTLQEAGVDLIWLLGDGEYNQQILDFVLKEVGVNIVTLAARYTGQLAEEMRTTSEQKIRDAAKNMLTELVMRKISRVLELKTN